MSPKKLHNLCYLLGKKYRKRFDSLLVEMVKEAKKAGIKTQKKVRGGHIHSEEFHLFVSRMIRELDPALTLYLSKESLND